MLASNAGPLAPAWRRTASPAPLLLKPLAPPLYNRRQVPGRRHRDAPFGRAHFGSLVVALPWSFESGALAMRQDGREATWEAAAGVAGQRLQWCAFFPDVEHEVGWE